MRNPRFWNLITGGAGALGIAAAVCAYGVDQIERPADQVLIQTFHAHMGSLERARCQNGDASTRRRLSELGAEFVTCDHDGTLRISFGGNRLGLSIGPGWTKGLTYIPTAPQRHGRMVGSTDHAEGSPADVYLRPIQNGWFIYYQRDQG